MPQQRSLIEKPHVPGVYEEPEAGSDPLGPFLRGLLGDQDPGSLSGAAGATAGMLPVISILKKLGFIKTPPRPPRGIAEWSAPWFEDLAPDAPQRLAPSRMNTPIENEFGPVQAAAHDPAADALAASRPLPKDPAKPAPRKPAPAPTPKNPADKRLREHEVEDPASPKKRKVR